MKMGQLRYLESLMANFHPLRLDHSAEIWVYVTLPLDSSSFAINKWLLPVLFTSFGFFSFPFLLTQETELGSIYFWEGRKRDRQTNGDREKDELKKGKEGGRCERRRAGDNATKRGLVGDKSWRDNM